MVLFDLFRTFCLFLFFQWSVFSCGHCICCRCSWVLLRQAGIGPRHRNVHVKCPMCRIPTLAQEISYVSTGRSQDKDTEENVTVKVVWASLFRYKKKKLILICNCHRFLSEQVLRNEWFIRSTWLYRLKKLKHNLNRSSIYLRNANSSAPITINKLSRAAKESSKLNQENCLKRGKTSLTKSRLLLILIWLFEEVARIFWTNNKVKKRKTEAITDKFRLSIL